MNPSTTDIQKFVLTWKLQLIITNLACTWCVGDHVNKVYLLSLKIYLKYNANLNTLNKGIPSYVNRIRIYFQRTVEVCHYIGLQRRGRTAVICDRCMRPTFPLGACCFTATVCHHYSFLCPFIHFTFSDWREEQSSLRMTSNVSAMRLQ